MNFEEIRAQLTAKPILSDEEVAAGEAIAIEHDDILGTIYDAIKARDEQAYQEACMNLWNFIIRTENP